LFHVSPSSQCVAGLRVPIDRVMFAPGAMHTPP
jgi:hypothetical protein